MLEKLALQKGLISREDHDKAVAVCAASENYETSLKEYFIANGLINTKQLGQLLRAITKAQAIRVNIKFGQLAVQLGFIDEKTLALALETQKKNTAQNGSSKLMGQILFEWGKLTREQVAQVLQTQKRLKKPSGNNRAESTCQPPTDPSVTDVSVAPSQQTQQTPQAQQTQQTQQTPQAQQAQQTQPSQPSQPPVQKVAVPADAKAGEKNGSMTRERLDGGMVLEIQQDNMAAYLTKTAEFSSSIEAETVGDLLGERGIFFGVVSDEMIQGFIRSSGFKTKRFRVAKGKEAVQGRDAGIEYFFETDYLKIGGMDDTGKIDFRERGVIPKIPKGCLLAEKTPMKESRNGRDIFDRILEVPQSRDVELKTQTGAILSQDGNRLFADRSGFPQLTWSGHINVVETFMIKGNVGYATGHVSYDGDVQVNGCLKSGFKISCRNLSIGEVDGGEITARGDVTILDGVNDARIHTTGNLTAKFVHHSKIAGLGHVQVVKEIVDSEIRAGGTCDISKGEVINSELHARMGVYVKQLGTRKTNPNTVCVGKNAYTEDELATIDKDAARLSQKMETVSAQRTTALEKKQRKGDAAKLLATQLKMTAGHISGIEKKPAEARTTGEASQLRQLLLKFNRLDNELNQAMDQIYALEIKEKRLADQLADREMRCAELAHEKRNLGAWQEANKGNPMVVVEGEIISDTVVAGPNAEMEFKESRKRVKIRESLLKDQDTGREEYTITVYDHR